MGRLRGVNTSRLFMGVNKVWFIHTFSAVECFVAFCEMMHVDASTTSTTSTASTASGVVFSPSNNPLPGTHDHTLVGGGRVITFDLAHLPPRVFVEAVRTAVPRFEKPPILPICA